MFHVFIFMIQSFFQLIWFFDSDKDLAPGKSYFNVPGIQLDFFIALCLISLILLSINELSLL